MTRRKTPVSPESEVDADRDDFQGGRVLTRKHVLEMIKRKESLAEGDFRGSDLSGICFDGLNLSEAKFAEANLSRSTFKGANLSGASLFGANLQDASLEEAILDQADFDYANLDGACLRGAKLRRTVFPNRRVSPEAVREAVRTGKKLTMDAVPADDDE